MDEVFELIQLIKNYGAFDNSAFANCEEYLKEHLTRLNELIEPGSSHAQETTLTHTYNVVKAIHSILESLKNQSNDLPFLEQLYLLISKEKLQKHLQKKVGNYDRYTLLFFATLFHDVGKLGYFVKTEKSLVELNKYNKHSFLSGFMVNFSKEGITAIDEEINKLEEEFNALKMLEEKTKKQLKAYEETRQLKVQLKLIKKEIKKHSSILNDLNFNANDIEYMVFLTSNHMNCYDSFQMYVQIVQNPKNKKISNQIQNLKLKIFDLITHFQDKYLDLILFFISDKLGTGGFTNSLPENVVKYVDLLIKLKENNNYEIEKFLLE